ncbi:forespore capture DNA-binding protein RefZ [Pontibacillus sp. HMF3514]|uniref:forespore capture DNA-binding protein RefZ n=1 Tax=Pontibacillus sp. HMF3514 TaxID=2692425 RepID=UPI0013204B2F|nr:forespore capture DNA-binding protein RefZ [Pontibacillus sp. HMF3514]QHE53272.1 forespore capture DNA-binding protein RefZ [Pontibacillus sp. HMF3514]
MRNATTKQKVMDAAGYLFFTKGYHGTSVREIAGRAKVNVSLISYHFKNKQGLLEYLMVEYFEPYIELLEEYAQKEDTRESFYRLIELIIQYKKKHYQFTCFVHRELTLDNVLVREMMVTYLAKEKYILYRLFKQCLHGSGIKGTQLQYLFLQFKGMLMTPFMMPYDMRDQNVLDHSDTYFSKQYSKTIIQWFDHLIDSHKYCYKKEGVI